MPVAVDPADLADLRMWATGPPHDLFDALRREGPVHWVPGAWGTQDSDGYWAVVSHAEVLEVARAPEVYTSTRAASYPTFVEEVADLGRNMMGMDAPEHERVRALALRTFTPRVVARFDEWVRGITVETLDAAYAKGRFDFVTDVASVIPARVIGELMGVPRDDANDVLEWSKRIFDRDTPDGREAAAQAMRSLLRYAIELRDRKRLEPGVDVVSELVSGDADVMTDGEYRHYIMLLLAAGFETTHTLMSQTTRMLLEDDAIATSARDAVAHGSTRPMIDEFLRMVSPAMNMARFSTRDAELGGQEIRGGQMVVMWLAAANRDPEVFADPHRFLAAREPNNQVSFGAPGSPHYCLGHALGRLEGTALVENLLARPALRLEGDPSPSGGVFINALKALPVEVA